MDFLCLFVIFDDKSSTTNGERGEGGGDEVRKIPTLQNSRNCTIEGNTNCTRTDGFPEFAELERVSFYFQSFFSLPLFLVFPISSPLFLTFHLLFVSLSLLFPVNFFSFPQYNVYSHFLFLFLSLRYLVFNLVWYYFVFSIGVQ
jgi:hypothetical protein